jgi:hypothetical protein
MMGGAVAVVLMLPWLFVAYAAGKNKRRWYE